MNLCRRAFLAKIPQVLATGPVLLGAVCTRSQSNDGDSKTNLSGDLSPAVLSGPGIDNWEAVRRNFSLDESYIHMAVHLVASHPVEVKRAIAEYRENLDRNPALYLSENNSDLEDAVREQAATYLEEQVENIALTDSTTEGLGIIYTGIKLADNQETITTHHDYYSTHKALEYRKDRTGHIYRQIPIFSDWENISQDQIVDSLVENIRDQTKLVALTWVHSSTGLKFPVRQLTERIREINEKRNDQDKILVSLDGVHGFGVEKDTPADLGVDIFISGCHKWIFGPRGTGIVWASDEAWTQISPVIPSFSGIETKGKLMTPGGFYAFEHRWALAEAFKFHIDIGRVKITDRIHELNRHCKEGLAKMSHINLITPMSADLSSGIICFDVKGMEPDEVVEKLADKNIIASRTPYITDHARLSIGLWNTHEEVDAVLAAIHSLA